MGEERICLLKYSFWSSLGHSSHGTTVALRHATDPLPSKFPHCVPKPVPIKPSERFQSCFLCTQCRPCWLSCFVFSLQRCWHSLLSISTIGFNLSSGCVHGFNHDLTHSTPSTVERVYFCACFLPGFCKVDKLL